MGLDGFSMGNLGFSMPATSAQMLGQTEHTINKALEIKIKNVEKPDEKQGVSIKDEDRENQYFSGGGSNSSKDEDDDESQDGASLNDLYKNNPNEFSVRINPETEKIELFNNVDNRIVETISAADLMKLISKMDSASGILVNRKI